jgi:prepilin-type N-terminal cleavage/methylation domain-containing protein
METGLNRAKGGFTMVEVMLVISIIGFLAALGIPSILGAYTKAQNTAREQNIVSVEKAKSTLTLPPGIVTGAMNLKADDPFDETVLSNLFAVLKISDISELTVGNTPINIGDLSTKAYYY